MTRSQTTIPFHNLTFHDDLPKLRDVEKRLTNSHRRLRAKVHGTDIRNVSIGYAGELIDESVSYLREACLYPVTAFETERQFCLARVFGSS